jgi:uncharacterized protein (TIGR02145 family)
MQLLSSHISNDKKSRIVFYSAVTALFILTLLAIFPAASEREVSAAATESTINLSVSASQVSMFIRTSPTGVFMKSDDLGINVKTNNYTGYTLSIMTKDGNDKLVNGELDNCKTEMGYGTDHDHSDKCYINSLSSAVSESDYNSNAAYNNTWGYKPSKLNSSVNANFQPAPTTKSVLDATEAANTANNTYTLAVGLRLDNTIPDGTYNNAFIISAVANEINYSIKFEDNTEDSTVANLPDIIASSTAETRIKLPSTIPTRKGYTFSKWCLGEVTEKGTVCNGVDYLPSTEQTPSYFGIDQTADNTNIKLYAVWTANINQVEYRIRYQNADGTYPQEYESYKQSVPTGGCIDYNVNPDPKYYESAGQIVCPTEDAVVELNLARKTYTLTIEHNEEHIESVTGAGTYRWGEEIAISATPKEGSKFTQWHNGTYPVINTDSGVSQIADEYSASTTATMSIHDATIYADGAEEYTGEYFSTFTLEKCNTLAVDDDYSIRDDRDNQDYTVRSLIGKCWMTKNLNIAGGITLTPEFTNISEDYYLPEADADAFIDGTAKADVFNSNRTECNINNPCYSYYSFMAAAAGANPDSGSITEDICPKGWKIPSAAEYNNLHASYTNLQKSAFKATFANIYRNGAYMGGQGGYLWTSDVYDSGKAYYINYNGLAYINNYELGKSVGLPIRCVMKTTSTSELTYMQDVTPNAVSNTAESTTATLIDRRDGNSYKVVKANGKLWMTENLNLAGGTVLTPTLSNVTSNFTLPLSGYNSFTSNTKASVYNSSSTNCTDSISCYSYYSYVAATAGSNPSSGNAKQDICPKGWRLPTKNDYIGLLNSRYSGSTPPTTAPFTGVFAGYISGSYDGGGSSGFYWTSTAESADDANALVFNTNSAYVNSNFNSKNSGYAVRCVSK